MDENKFIAENPASTTSGEVAPRPKREAGGIPKILGFTRTYNALLYVDGFYKRNGGKGEYFFMRRSFYKGIDSSDN
ncbi:hypothetical protein MMC22_002278 [Lobaria immixta]|nr:hypothetical protein [Lobaria immixta]